MNEPGAISNEQEAVDLVSKARSKNDDVIEFSTGVKLKINNELSSTILIDIIADLENDRPEPPEVYVEAIDRYEINFDDPEYAKRLERWNTVGSRRIIDALILLGTEVYFVPEGTETHNDNKWIGLLEVLGFKINRRDDSERYLAWVKRVAVKTTNDLKELTEQVGRRAGVSESDVNLAQSSFPGKKG